MEQTEEEKLFFARFQTLKFDNNLEKGTPSQKADILRNLIIHLNSAPHHKIVSDVTSKKLKEEYFKKYTSIVDCFDDSKGLNNFAAGALSLCTGKKNESQMWKSCLDVNKIVQEPFFRDYIDRCQSKPCSKENDQPLFRPRKKKLVPDTQPIKQEPEKPRQPLPAYFTGNGSKSIASNSNIATSTEKTSINQPFSSFKASSSSTNPGGSTDRASVNPQSNSFAENIPNQNGQNSKSTGNYAISSNLSNTNNTQNPNNRHVSVYGNPTGIDRGNNSEDQPMSRQYPQKKSLFSGNSRSNYRENTGGSWNQRRNEWKKRQRGEIDDDDDEEYGDEIQYKPPAPSGPFKTARDQLAIEQSKKYGGGNRGQQNQGQVSTSAYGGVKKSLGTRRGPSSKFVPPVISRDEDGCMLKPDNRPKGDNNEDEPVDERLKGIDPKMIELINNEIMDHGPTITWDDVAGLEFAKKTIKEIVVWPMLRPDIFTGLRGPPKGLLLFGPPGTGKTLIGKCIASQSKSTFFCISASSLTSKWVGEGEKMVRALFAVARCNQPAVIFIDEIDSLLSQRSDNEHEASRRIKTEFLVQLDGAATDSDDRILIIGATNRPQEIDEAARRRFVKRLYIPLPEDIARRQIVVNLLSQQTHSLTDQDLDIICQKSDGYSGSDMANLCREAALGPIRSIPFDQIETITNDQVRPINLEDFLESLTQVRASVSDKDLDLYINWNKLYGSFGK